MYGPILDTKCDKTYVNNVNVGQTLIPGRVTLKHVIAK